MLKDNEELTIVLNDFLSERRKSENGGYAPVTKEDLQQLRAIVEMIIEAKWEEGCNGASSVNFSLVDRTQYRSVSYVPVPYDRYEDSRKETRVVFEELMYNLEVATHDVQQFLKVHKVKKD